MDGQHPALVDLRYIVLHNYDAEQYWFPDCNVIGLLCNNKDLIVYTTLLTAILQVCFLMNVLKTNALHITRFIYTAGMPMGVADFHYQT